MINLIIPAAGKSTRFISKPKWLLTAPNGNLMIQECIRGLNLQNVKHIYITVLTPAIPSLFLFLFFLIFSMFYAFILSPNPNHYFSSLL